MNDFIIESSDKILSEPTQFCAGVYGGYIDTPIGTLELIADENELYEVHIASRINMYLIGNSIVESAKRQLSEYFARQRRVFDLPFAPHVGSDFSRSVWNRLRYVLYGQTKSYNDIAAEMGLAESAEAVESALCKNPLIIIIPCHRIVKADGSSGCFSGGNEKIKTNLLRLEEH